MEDNMGYWFVTLYGIVHSEDHASRPADEREFLELWLDGVTKGA
jgi:hypothetical protein